MVSNYGQYCTSDRGESQWLARFGRAVPATLGSHSNSLDLLVPNQRPRFKCPSQGCRACVLYIPYIPNIHIRLELGGGGRAGVSWHWVSEADRGSILCCKNGKKLVCVTVCTVQYIVVSLCIAWLSGALLITTEYCSQKSKKENKWAFPKVVRLVCQ